MDLKKLLNSILDQSIDSSLEIIRSKEKELNRFVDQLNIAEDAKKIIIHFVKKHATMVLDAEITGDKGNLPGYTLACSEVISLFLNEREFMQLKQLQEELIYYGASALCECDDSPRYLN